MQKFLPGALMALLALVACGGGGGATPPPLGNPGVTPTPAPTGTPGANPSSTPTPAATTAPRPSATPTVAPTMAPPTPTPTPLPTGPMVYSIDPSLFGSNADIASFSVAANGNVAPTRRIAGANTGLTVNGDGMTLGLAANPATHQLFTMMGNQLLTFAANETGNTAPTSIASLTNGASSPAGTLPAGFTYSGGPIAFDPTSGNLYIAAAIINTSANTATFEIDVIPANSSGSVTPTHVITSSMFTAIRGIAVDGSGNLYVSNDGNTSNVLMFANAATLNGSAMPTAVIGATTLITPAGLAIDSQGRVFVADAPNNAVVVFGNMSAGFPLVGMIGGATSTVLGQPAGVALDATGGIWVSDASGSSTGNGNGVPVLFRFSLSTAIGQSSPTPTNAIAGLMTTLANPRCLQVF